MSAALLKPTAFDIVEDNPEALLIGEVEIDDYVRDLKKIVGAVDAKVETKKGRDVLKSAAQKVRTRKAAIDRKRKDLTQGWRDRTAAVNDVGKKIEAKLNDVIEEIRKPVTEWEEREQKRQNEADAIIAMLQNAGVVTHGTTSEDASSKLEEIRGLNLNDEILGPRIDMAEQLKLEAVEALAQIVTDLKAQEKERQELDQLRKQQAAEEERRQREAAEKAAAEAAEAARKAEEERVAKAAEEAAAQAKRDAEEAARRDREAQEAAARAEIEAAEERARQAEREAQEERDRLAREEQERQRKIEAEKEAQRQREADLAHRSEVQEKAAEALFDLPGMTQKLARSVVSQIAAGSVPAVRIEF